MQLSDLRRGASALLVLLIGSSCGGGGTGPGGGGGGTQFGMSAKADGANWSPSFQAIAAHVVAGNYIITGTSTASGGSSITISLSNIGGPGDYALGVGPSAFGGTAQWVAGSKGWVTDLNGVAGTVHIESVSDTHMKGTFSFDAVGLTGGAAGTVHITQGAFDLDVNTNGNPGPLGDGKGSRITASVDGATYNAATLAVDFLNDTTLIVASTTSHQGIGIYLYGVHGAGQYDASLSPHHSLTYTSSDGGPYSNWGSTASDSGSIVITSVTATRVTGTYTLRLGEVSGPAATGPIHVTGDFSLGRSH